MRIYNGHTDSRRGGGGVYKRPLPAPAPPPSARVGPRRPAGPPVAQGPAWGTRRPRSSRRDNWCVGDGGCRNASAMGAADVAVTGGGGGGVCGDARPAGDGRGPRVGSGGRGKGLGTNPADRLTAPVARVATATTAAPPGRPLRARGQASPGRGHGSPAGMTDCDGGGTPRPHFGMHRARRSPRGGVTCRRLGCTTVGGTHRLCGVGAPSPTNWPHGHTQQHPRRHYFGWI